MAGTVKLFRLESQAAHDKLKPRRQPYWQSLMEDKEHRVHLGWQR